MPIQSFDTQLLVFVNHRMANPLFDVLMPALSLQGYLLVAPLLLYLIVLSTNRTDQQWKRHLAITIGTIIISCLAVYVSGFAEDWLKSVIGRVRPCRAMDDLRLILPCPNSNSMPSGHAISSFAFATPLFYMSQNILAMRWRSYPLILASLIAFSRIYLGVHYPTDVLAGAVLGGTVGSGLSFLYHISLRKLS
jgi:undecaprenyl-diphosphatase